VARASLRRTKCARHKHPQPGCLKRSTPSRVRRIERNLARRKTLTRATSRPPKPRRPRRDPRGTRARPVLASRNGSIHGSQKNSTDPIKKNSLRGVETLFDRDGKEPSDVTQQGHTWAARRVRWPFGFTCADTPVRACERACVTVCPYDTDSSGPHLSIPHRARVCVSQKSKSALAHRLRGLTTCRGTRPRRKQSRISVLTVQHGLRDTLCSRRAGVV
jgi:hypothetical protein